MILCFLRDIFQSYISYHIKHKHLGLDNKYKKIKISTKKLRFTQLTVDDTLPRFFLKNMP